jgi:hypothetical protein
MGNLLGVNPVVLVFAGAHAIRRPPKTKLSSF